MIDNLTELISADDAEDESERDGYINQSRGRIPRAKIFVDTGSSQPASESREPLSSPKIHGGLRRETADDKNDAVAALRGFTSGLLQRRQALGSNMKQCDPFPSCDNGRSGATDKRAPDPPEKGQYRQSPYFFYGHPAVAGPTSPASNDMGAPYMGRQPTNSDECVVESSGHWDDISRRRTDKEMNRDGTAPPYITEDNSAERKGELRGEGYGAQAADGPRGTYVNSLPFHISSKSERGSQQYNGGRKSFFSDPGSDCNDSQNGHNKFEGNLMNKPSNDPSGSFDVTRNSDTRLQGRYNERIEYSNGTDHALKNCDGQHKRDSFPNTVANEHAGYMDEARNALETRRDDYKSSHDEYGRHPDGTQYGEETGSSWHARETIDAQEVLPKTIGRHHREPSSGLHTDYNVHHTNSEDNDLQGGFSHEQKNPPADFSEYHRDSVFAEKNLQGDDLNDKYNMGQNYERNVPPAEFNGHHDGFVCSEHDAEGDLSNKYREGPNHEHKGLTADFNEYHRDSIIVDASNLQGPRTDYNQYHENFLHAADDSKGNLDEHESPGAKGQDSALLESESEVRWEGKNSDCLKLSSAQGSTRHKGNTNLTENGYRGGFDDPYYDPYDEGSKREQYEAPVDLPAGDFVCQEKNSQVGYDEPEGVNELDMTPPQDSVLRNWTRPDYMEHQEDSNYARNELEGSYNGPRKNSNNDHHDPIRESNEYSDSRGAFHEPRLQVVMSRPDQEPDESVTVVKHDGSNEDGVDSYIKQVSSDEESIILLDYTLKYVRRSMPQ